MGMFREDLISISTFNRLPSQSIKISSHKAPSTTITVGIAVEKFINTRAAKHHLHIPNRHLTTVSLWSLEQCDSLKQISTYLLLFTYHDRVEVTVRLAEYTVNIKRKRNIGYQFAR